ncbi:hypothetical protein [Ectobacillus sp. sgz5001026]
MRITVGSRDREEKEGAGTNKGGKALFNGGPEGNKGGISEFNGDPPE